MWRPLIVCSDVSYQSSTAGEAKFDDLRKIYLVGKIQEMNRKREVREWELKEKEQENKLRKEELELKIKYLKLKIAHWTSA